MRSKPRILTNAELEILTVLWSAGPATAQDVYNVFALRRLAQCGTALNLMQVLTEKRLIQRDEPRLAQSCAEAKLREWIQPQLAFHRFERAFSCFAQAFLGSSPSGRRTWMWHKGLDEYEWGADTATRRDREIPAWRLSCGNA